MKRKPEYKVGYIVRDQYGRFYTIRRVETSIDIPTGRRLVRLWVGREEMIVKWRILNVDSSDEILRGSISEMSPANVQEIYSPVWKAGKR